MFADDTNIYYENDSLEEMEKLINIELKKLCLWLRINRLSLNISETNFVIFRPYNKKLKYVTTLKIDKKAIAEKSYIKYFGIIIDSSLTWKQHIFNISIKISRSIGILCKVKKILNQTMLSLYYSLIYSHIVYCIQAWGNAGETELNHILIYKGIMLNTQGILQSSNPLFLMLMLQHYYGLSKLVSTKLPCTEQGLIIQTSML